MLTLGYALTNDAAMPPASPDLIGSAEACEILGIDRSTLSRWVASDRLTYWVQLPGPNGAFLFDRKVVEALLEQAS